MPAKKKEGKEEVSLEEALEKLQETVTQLESQEISLEESFEVYKRGMDLLKYCNETLDRVEKKVLVLNESGKLDEF